MRLTLPALLVAALLVGGAAVAAPAGASDLPRVNAFAVPSGGPGARMFFAASGFAPGEAVQGRLVDTTDAASSFALAPLTAASGGGVVTPAGYRAPADVVPGTYDLELEQASGTSVTSTETVSIVAPGLRGLTDNAPGRAALFEMTGLGGDPAITRTVAIDGATLTSSVSEYISPTLPVTGWTRLSVVLPTDLAVGAHTLTFTQAASPVATLTRPFTLFAPSVDVRGTRGYNAGGIATQDSIVVDAARFGPAGATLSVRDAAGHTYPLPSIDGRGNASAVLPGLVPGDAVFTAVSTVNGSTATSTQAVLSPTLAAGASLGEGGVLLSPTARTALQMGWDGNVTVTHDGLLTWSSGTNSYRGYSPRLTVQSDGNLVAYGADGRVIWTARTATTDAPPRLSVLDDGRAVLTSAHGTVLWTSPTPATSTLTAGATLRSGAALTSGAYAFTVQTDGNAVLRRGAKVAFTTATAGNPGATMTLQTDGNLVLRARTGRALWANRTLVGTGASLSLQTDGNLVERASNGRAVWSTGTTGR